jgi:hypothetical protein
MPEVRRISKGDSRSIVKMLRSWTRRRVTWKLLQSEISTALLDGEEAWSRQALKANDEINGAWLKLKDRLPSGRRSHSNIGDIEDTELTRLRIEFSELQLKYDRLLLRHRMLMNNASLLPGGTQLLSDSLPNNTRSQAMPRNNRPRRIK